MGKQAHKRLPKDFIEDVWDGPHYPEKKIMIFKDKQKLWEYHL